MSPRASITYHGRMTYHPVHPLTITETHGRHIFQTYSVRLPWLIFFSVGGLCAGGFALLIAGMLLLSGVRTPHPDWRIVLFYNDLFMQPLAALGLLLISRYLVLYGRRVTLDNTGVIVWTMRGRTAAAWDEIAALYLGAYPRPPILVRRALLVFCPIAYLVLRYEAHRRYTLRLRDGRLLAIPAAMPGKDALASAIGSAIAEARLPAMLSLYREGQSCDFGPVRVASDGLHVPKSAPPWGEKALRWEEYDRVICVRMKLCIPRRGKNGPWASLPLTCLPNASLFLALLQQIGDEMRGT